MRSLIVDDNPSFGLEARSLLEREGMSVVGIALSGQEAVKLVEELRPEVVLLDISLGKESGFDVARRLVEGSTATAPTVILISAYDEREFSDRIAASPAVGFIAKVDLSADRVRRLLGE